VIATDVTQLAAVEQLARATQDTFGPIDVLVNNAGGVAHPAPFLDTPRANWDWEIDLNIWGVVNCTRVFGAGMVERGRGSIVQITSNSALVPEAANFVANYAGTKGYVMSLSMALAYEWGPHGVRVNCISPGWIVPWEKDHAGAGSFWKKYGYELFGTPEAMAEAAAEGRGALQRGNQPIRPDRPSRGHREPRDVLRLRSRGDGHGPARERERRLLHVLRKAHMENSVWQPGPRLRGCSRCTKVSIPGWIRLDADELLESRCAARACPTSAATRSSCPIGSSCARSTRRRSCTRSAAPSRAAIA
jgi:NAD(P)-dependent dehydrogenase (short-subunit alcohol dehydrogenase family)